MTKYEKIYNEIIDDINQSILRVGDSLPSENELSERFDTSRVTVRRALTQLENNGMIMKQQGKESIVVNNTLKPKTVLLIVPTLFKYIFIDLIKEIEQTLREQNVNLLIACSYHNQKIERDIIRTHIASVDGIIIEPTQAQYTKHINSTAYNALAKIPTVCINAKMEKYNFPYMILDDYKSTNELAKYVISKKCKRVLVLAKTDDLQGYTRLSGINDAFDNEVNLDYQVVEFTTYNEQDKLEEFAKAYLEYKPDCVMFYNDEYAYKILNNNHIIPEQEGIMVTGFDDTEYSNGTPYSFISPSHPKAVMGRDAANAIIKLMDKQEVESKIYQPLINFDK